MEKIIAACKPEPIHFRKYIDIETKNLVTEPFIGYLGSGIKDKHGREIFEEDTLLIDFDRAAKVIGDVFLVRYLIERKFSPDARLKVEFRDARFRLIWREHNASFDTGFDVSDIYVISKFVEIEED